MASDLTASAVDPRLPVTASVAVAAPGQSVDIAVAVSDELARSARSIEAALYYVVSHDEHARVIVVADRKELASAGSAAHGALHARLTLPLDAPASTVKHNWVRWFAGAVALPTRGSDVRSFVPLTVVAVPNPDAPAANAEPDRRDLGGNKTRGVCVLDFALSSRDVPLGAAFEGALRVTPWGPGGAPYEAASISISLTSGSPVGYEGTNETREVETHQLMGEAKLPSGTPLELPFRLAVPTDGDPTSDTAHPKPLGWIKRTGPFIGAPYAPDHIKPAPSGDRKMFSNRWWIVARVETPWRGGRGAEASFEVRVHNPPPSGAPAPSTRPAGWYAEPSGSGDWRWWDGHRWTEHTRAAQ